MKLSVILPCFNGAATIAVQMEALTRQDWPGGWEVLVVNNGSTDRSMEIVEAYRDRLPALSIVEAHVPGTPRLGVPHSYNTGIAAASGDAFVFCEADDEVGADWLAAMGKALARHEFVVARQENRKLNAEWLHPRFGNGYQSDGLHRMERPPHLLTASACGFGLRRSLYEAVGPFSIEFPIAHDTDYCLRVQLAGYSPHFEPDAVVHYRQKTDLLARFHQGRNWGRETGLVFERYGSPRRRFAPARQLVYLVAVLPSGAWAALQWALRLPRGRLVIADWIWELGWETGAVQATLQKPVAAYKQAREAAVAAASGQCPQAGEPALQECTAWSPPRPGA